MSNPLDKSLENTPRSITTNLAGTNQWRDIVCSMVPGLSMDWIREQPRLPWLGFGQFATAQTLEFASEQPIKVTCDRPAGVSEETCNLVLQLEGSGYCRHAGREAHWKRGDLVLFDDWRPFHVVHPTSYRLVMWKLPRKALAPMLAEPDRSAGKRISGSQGPGAILSSFLSSLTLEFEHCNPASQQALLGHLYGLVGLALGGSALARESRSKTHRAAKRQQVLTYVEAHLRDPRLTAQRAASELQISTRWLHALLEDTHLSFSQRVTQRRLEECCKQLTDPAFAYMTIAEVAFSWGYNDLSTFNRRFRAMYGITPRDVRAGSVDH